MTADGGRTKNRTSRRTIAIGLIVAAIAIIGSVAVYRLTSLRGLPDIGDPFDLVKYGTIEIPDDQNAFTFYVRAHEQLKKNEPQTMLGAYLDWSVVDQSQLQWLEANREALQIWFEGTKRDRGIYKQPGSVDFETLLPAIQNLRTFSRLANLEACRLDHEGRYADSWSWLRANLRASRHSGGGGAVIERLVGIALYAGSSKQAMHWADDPKVDASLIRQALSDVIALDALTPEIAGMIRTEYFAYSNTFARPGLRDQAVIGNFPGDPSATGPTLRQRGEAVVGVLIHEPERSLRVLRLITANYLAASKLSSVERAKRMTLYGKLALYTPVEAEAMPISPDELGRWFDSTRYAKVFLSAWPNVERAVRRDDYARAMLIVHLADQLYLREHGRLPESPDQLVGPYLKALPEGYDMPDPTLTPGTK